MDLPKAVEAYREILVADPTHPETRAALERMFMGGTMQIEIAEVLEPLYRTGEEWEKLHQIHEVQLGRVTDLGERQALLRRLAEIAEHKLVDQVAAFGWWAEAVKEDPSSAQALDELLRLARATHQWDAFVTTMSEAASADRPPAVRRDVLLRLAASFETDLGDLERAEKALLAVLNEHEKDVAALASLDRIYESQGMYENLAGVLRQRLATTDDTAELVSFNLRLGRVYAEALEERDLAIASYLAVLEHESQSREALDALERLYFRGERWSELYGVYEKIVDVTSDEMGLADCYARMAKLAADALDDRAKAVELWGKVVDIRGEDAIALSGLADLHEMAGEWNPLTEVLEKQVAATADGEARIPIYKRLGRIWGEKLSRERNSLESWQKVLEIDPQDVDALRAIAANYRSAGRLGGAVAGAAPSHPGRPAGRQRDRERRAQGAVRAARRARGRHPHAHAGRDRRLARGARARHRGLPRARGARAAVHAGGALGGGGRHPRAARGGAGQPDRAGRRPHAGGLAVGRQDRRRRLGGAGLRARAADRSESPDGLHRARAALSPAQELGEAGRSAAGADRVRDRRAGPHRAAGAGRGDLRAAARRSRQRVRHAAGGLPRGLLERPRRQGAGAPRDGGRQVERAHRRLHAGGAGDRRPQAGGRSVGQDRALVRLGAPPRRLRHRLGPAGAPARQRARRRAAGAGGLLPQAEALERSRHRAGAPRRVRDRSRRRGSTSSCSSPTRTRRRSATRRRR